MTGGSPSSKPAAWATLAAAALLAGARWYAMSTPDHFSAHLPAAWFTGPARSLTRATLNVGCCWVLLVLVPVALLVLLRCARPGQGLPVTQALGLTWPMVPTPAWRHSVWLLAVGGAALGLAAAALLPEVRATYPVYRAAINGGLPPLLLSAALTLALILATELFYRGAALQLPARGLGSLAIYLVLPIYVLDHLGAPTVELVGSAAAGALLGHLALGTRSVWPGFAVHACAAVAADLGSVWLG